MSSKYGFDSPHDRDAQRVREETAQQEQAEHDRLAAEAVISEHGEKIQDILQDFAQSANWGGPPLRMAERSAAEPHTWVIRRTLPPHVGKSIPRPSDPDVKLKVIVAGGTPRLQLQAKRGTVPESQWAKLREVLQTLTTIEVTELSTSR